MHVQSPYGVRGRLHTGVRVCARVCARVCVFALVRAHLFHLGSTKWSEKLFARMISLPSINITRPDRRGDTQ